MELRNLQATDLFSMVRILNGIGFKNIKESIDISKITEIRNMMKSTDLSEDEKTKLVSNLGSEVVFSIVGVLVENIPLIENDLYSFMGNVAGIKAKDVAKMDIGEFMDLLITIVQKEEFKDFFNRASKLIR